MWIRDYKIVGLPEPAQFLWTPNRLATNTLLTACLFFLVLEFFSDPDVERPLLQYIEGSCWFALGFISWRDWRRGDGGFLTNPAFAVFAVVAGISMFLIL